MSQITFKKREIVYRPYESILKFIIDLVMIVCIAFLLVLALSHKTKVEGNSMSALVNDQDTILINKAAYAFHGPERYDVILFSIPESEPGEYFVKRVIGLPGETVVIQNGHVYIDGELLADDVIENEIYNAGLAAAPMKLSYNEYFVLGDNRNNSDDSRFSHIGLVKRSNIIGKPWFCIAPIANFGPITDAAKIIEPETEIATEAKG